MPRTDYENPGAGQISVSGMSGIRLWADSSPQEMSEFLEAGNIRVSDADHHLNILALSGGGSAGAYGAGLLNGWSKHGDRPTFDIVTGVSAGALIAPFAYLGPTYDGALTRVFSPEVTTPLNKGVTPFRIMFSNGISSNKNLKALIDDLVTPELLRAIAKEDRVGRKLFVLTTNLDAQRPVIWDMGAIARSSDRNSVTLFRQVLLASASVPGFYPAVRIPIAGPDGTYEELHCDGGVFAQFFVGPDAFLTNQRAIAPPKGNQADLYVIVNNSLDPDFSVTKDSILSVASRSYETLLKSHARADIEATFLYARSNHNAFHLAYLEENVPYDFRKPFAPAYVSRVFALGYATGLAGTWRREPSTGP